MESHEEEEENPLDSLTVSKTLKQKDA